MTSIIPPSKGSWDLERNMIVNAISKALDDYKSTSNNLIILSLGSFSFNKLFSSHHWPYLTSPSSHTHTHKLSFKKLNYKYTFAIITNCRSVLHLLLLLLFIPLLLPLLLFLLLFLLLLYLLLHHLFYSFFFFSTLTFFLFSSQTHISLSSSLRFIFIKISCFTD